MLDINLFRVEKGNDPEVIWESQRRRYGSVELVDDVVMLDTIWRQCQKELDNIRKEKNQINEKIKQKKIAKEDASELISQMESLQKKETEKGFEVKESKESLDAKLKTVGNLVHDSVPISNDEVKNVVERTWGFKREEAGLKNHVDLVQLLGIADLDKGGTGADTAGGRGYYLKGLGVILNQALINFGLAFLYQREYIPVQTPFFMRKDVMAECAQLSQFDEELYKGMVSGEGDDKYLIATSEQPLCAFHQGDWIHPKKLPLRYAGYSSCFRKEVGAHGRDTLSIFRVHQFEKIEQFCVTSPLGDASWEMHEEMLKNSEEFYQKLGIPYQVVSIVSGALNDAAAKKYDLEAWFPASKAYRELVSCSNCTDYQSRNLEVQYGQKTKNDSVKQYVHLLNSTLTATERTICCILENYQTKEGVEVLEALQPYMMGIKFIPFQESPTSTSTSTSTSLTAKSGKPKAEITKTAPAT